MDSIKMHEIVGEYLKDGEIDAVLIPRDLILDWLAEQCAKLGENVVYY